MSQRYRGAELSGLRSLARAAASAGQPEGNSMDDPRPSSEKLLPSGMLPLTWTRRTPSSAGSSDERNEFRLAASPPTGSSVSEGEFRFSQPDRNWWTPRISLGNRMSYKGERSSSVTM